MNCLKCNKILTIKQKKYCSTDCQRSVKKNIKKYDVTKSIQCVVDGKIFSMGAKQSGALKKYSKNTLLKKYDDIDWIIIDNPENNISKWQCPLCEWNSIDIENKSGWISTHIEDKHNISIDDFCIQFPEHKNLWKMYWIRNDRKKDLTEDFNSITCLVCNEQMKKITNAHLKTHGMTNETYKSKFGLDNLSSEGTRKKLSKLYFENDAILSNNYNSAGQSEIEAYINELGFETKIRRIDNVELDIFIPSKNIAVEYNGLYWHSEFHGKKDRNYHLNKTNYCERNGIHLIHIFEDEWKTHKEIIKSRIKNILGKNEIKIYARKCIIEIINPSIKSEFLKTNHIQGNDSSLLNLGLFNNGILMSVMTFRKPSVSMGHKNISGNKVELSRFCSIHNTNVIGGADKLFKYFLKNYNQYTEIISYADRRWTSTIGKSLYDNLGFDCIGKSSPNYWYMKRHVHREPRYNYTKHNIIKNFTTANPNLSEWENMILLKYDRIWDCGSLKYIFKVS